MMRFAFALLAAPATAQPALLPLPARMETTGAGFVLDGSVGLAADDAGTKAAGARLAALMATQGVALRTGRGRVTVRFVRAGGVPAEGYRLETGPDGATITASDDAGLLHGATTLWQLATQDAGQDAGHRVAGVRIADAPRFAWRGLMLDSARHFQSPAFVKRLIDWMAAAKLNRLHWHLVDDQGWRMPVPGWPRLTEVSAWRRPASAPGAPPLPVTGGFYSEAEIRGIVAYAAARGITVVPEIELPGHALAAIRAYPKLGMGVAMPPGTESDWGVFPWLYNTDEATFAFLEDVLRQTMRLFPSPWIHLGGDEATKEQWRASPAIQAQIRRLGLKDEDALQGWFMARAGRFLTANGRRMIGWDEILEGGVPADATITSWRGIAGGVAAAKAGHDAIMSPAPVLYLNHRQGGGPDEPPGRGQIETLADVLAFDPVPAELSAAEAGHIIGVQGNLWTEHARTEARAAWMMFPRALAVAETGWTGRPSRDVTGFVTRLAPQLDRMKPLGLAAADSASAVTARLDRAGAGVKVTLATQTALPVRYTIDGTVPGTASARYDGPITLAAGTRVRAATFLGGRALDGGYDARATLAAALTRTSRELVPCSDKAVLDLEDDWPTNGPRAHYLIDILQPCWRWDAAPMAGITRVALSVGQLPFNFQVGADRAKIAFRAPASAAGEFELREGCGGALLATFPLARAAGNPGVTRLEAALARSARQADLCLTYTARGPDPLWAIERVELLP